MRNRALHAMQTLALSSACLVSLAAVPAFAREDIAKETGRATNATLSKLQEK